MIISEKSDASTFGTDWELKALKSHFSGSDWPGGGAVLYLAEGILRGIVRSLGTYSEGISYKTKYV